MSMQVLRKRTDSGSRRLRRRRDGSGLARPTTAWPESTRDPAEPPPQDQALYTCGCGFVFEAHVSTSVACPHCRAEQAW
jgi:hypothetical protein